VAEELRSLSEDGLTNEADQQAGRPHRVGTAGFEPATPATPLQCATGLRYVPSDSEAEL
jgi:hypothetical protein